MRRMFNICLYLENKGEWKDVFCNICKVLFFYVGDVAWFFLWIVFLLFRSIVKMFWKRLEKVFRR